MYEFLFNNNYQRDFKDIRRRSRSPVVLHHRNGGRVFPTFPSLITNLTPVKRLNSGASMPNQSDDPTGSSVLDRPTSELHNARNEKGGTVPGIEAVTVQQWEERQL
jgi:hypothetical protein